jgi:hypothetical protein
MSTAAVVPQVFFKFCKINFRLNIFRNIFTVMPAPASVAIATIAWTAAVVLNYPVFQKISAICHFQEHSPLFPIFYRWIVSGKRKDESRIKILLLPCRHILKENPIDWYHFWPTLFLLRYSPCQVSHHHYPILLQETEAKKEGGF